MVRGEIWWAALDQPRGSEPGYRRPVLIVQADTFNRSAIRTVVCAVVTTNLALGGAPGNVPVPAATAGMERESVVNVSQLVTLDRAFLTECTGALPRALMREVDAGLALVLGM